MATVALAGLSLEEPLRRKPFAAVLFSGAPTIAGAAIVCVVTILAIFAPWIAPHDPNLQNLATAFKPPSWLAGGSAAYLLGTDDLGRDIFSRIVWGARIAYLARHAAQFGPITGPVTTEASSPSPACNKS